MIPLDYSAATDCEDNVILLCSNVEFTSHYWLLEAVNPDVNGETDLQRLVYPGMEAVGIQKVRCADETWVSSVS
jgi:hypothetical protein